MKQYTKIGLFFILIFLVSTAYAFAAMLMWANPRSESLNLVFFGISMIAAGQFLRIITRKP